MDIKKIYLIGRYDHFIRSTIQMSGKSQVLVVW